MAREIPRNVHWIQQCKSQGVGPGTGRAHRDWHEGCAAVHRCFNAYLIDDDRTLLFDTTAPFEDDLVRSELVDLLDGRDLDYLVLSHPETPHAGNTPAILRDHPAATVVAPDVGSMHDHYHLGDSMKVEPGDELDLGRRTVEFVFPSFVDHGMHTWLYEPTADVLFTVDYMGMHHFVDECLTFVSESDAAVTVDRLYDYHKIPLFWFAYADPALIDPATDALIDRFGDSTIAPSHGPVIDEDAGRHMALVKPMIEKLKRAKGAA